MSSPTGSRGEGFIARIARKNLPILFVDLPVLPQVAAMSEFLPALVALKNNPLVHALAVLFEVGLANEPLSTHVAVELLLPFEMQPLVDCYVALVLESAAAHVAFVFRGVVVRVVQVFPELVRIFEGHVALLAGVSFFGVHVGAMALQLILCRERVGARRTTVLGFSGWGSRMPEMVALNEMRDR